MWTRTYDGPTDGADDGQTLDVGDPEIYIYDDAAADVTTDTHDNVIVVGRCACTPGVKSTIWVRKYTP
jgi:hypothetical protein